MIRGRLPLLPSLLFQIVKALRANLYVRRSHLSFLKDAGALVIGAHGTRSQEDAFVQTNDPKDYVNGVESDTDCRVAAGTMLAVRYIGVADNQAPRPTVPFTIPSSRFLRTFS